MRSLIPLKYGTPLRAETPKNIRAHVDISTTLPQTPNTNFEKLFYLNEENNLNYLRLDDPTSYTKYHSFTSIPTATIQNVSISSNPPINQKESTENISINKLQVLLTDRPPTLSPDTDIEQSQTLLFVNNPTITSFYVTAVADVFVKYGYFTTSGVNPTVHKIDLEQVQNSAPLYTEVDRIQIMNTNFQAVDSVITPDNRSLVIFSTTEFVFIDVATFTVRETYTLSPSGNYGNITCATVDPNGTFIFIGCNFKFVRFNISSFTITGECPTGNTNNNIQIYTAPSFYQPMYFMRFCLCDPLGDRVLFFTCTYVSSVNNYSTTVYVFSTRSTWPTAPPYSSQTFPSYFSSINATFSKIVENRTGTGYGRYLYLLDGVGVKKYFFQENFVFITTADATYNEGSLFRNCVTVQMDEEYLYVGVGSNTSSNLQSTVVRKLRQSNLTLTSSVVLSTTYMALIRSSIWDYKNFFVYFFPFYHISQIPGYLIGETIQDITVIHYNVSTNTVGIPEITCYEKQFYNSFLTDQYLYAVGLGSFSQIDLETFTRTAFLSYSQTIQTRFVNCCWNRNLNMPFAYVSCYDSVYWNFANASSKYYIDQVFIEDTVTLGQYHFPTMYFADTLFMEPKGRYIYCSGFNYTAPGFSSNPYNCPLTATRIMQKIDTLNPNNMVKILETNLFYHSNMLDYYRIETSGFSAPLNDYFQCPAVTNSLSTYAYICVDRKTIAKVNLSTCQVEDTFVIPIAYDNISLTCISLDSKDEFAYLAGGIQNVTAVIYKFDVNNMDMISSIHLADCDFSSIYFCVAYDSLQNRMFFANNGALSPAFWEVDLGTFAILASKEPLSVYPRTCVVDISASGTPYFYTLEKNGNQPAIISRIPRRDWIINPDGNNGDYVMNSLALTEIDNKSIMRSRSYYNVPTGEKRYLVLYVEGSTGDVIPNPVNSCSVHVRVRIRI